MQTLQNILYGLGIGLFTIFFFGLCVFVHELGHLLVALWRGLTPEKFSVGFGKKIWGFTRGGVEYQVSMIPFGGYVALPQLDPSDTEPETTDGRKLPFAKPLDRAIVALAGPAANIVFGFFLALFVWWFGVYAPVTSQDCQVYSVPEASAEYQAGLRPGDHIISVNGKGLTRGWGDIAERIVLSTGEVSLGLVRGGQPLEIRYKPQPNPEVENLGYPFFKVTEPTIVDQAQKDSPAAKAGLQPKDRILSVNGKPVEHPAVFIKAIAASNGQPVTLGVERAGKQLEIAGIVPQKMKGGTDDTPPAYRIGAVLAPMLVLTHPNPWKQFTNTFTRTRDTLRSLLTRGSLVKPNHMSGPIGILQATGINVYLGGFQKGLDFIVMVCFSLAIFNLFPVPVLDGGHIVIAGIEGVSRRRIPAKLAEYVQTAFAILLIGFMLYVTVFDILRTPKLWKRMFGKEQPVPAQVEPKAVPAMKQAAPPAPPAK